MTDPINERSTALQRLEILVGQWNVELVFPGDPPVRAQTQASFEWLDDNRFFLMYRRVRKSQSTRSGTASFSEQDTTRFSIPGERFGCH
jgi:hypothetical protein